MINQLLQFDQSLFYWFHSILGFNQILDYIILFIGKYLVYFIPIGLLVSWFIYNSNQDRIAMIKTTLVSVFVWQVPTRIIAYFWYRPRPFVELGQTKELFFHLPSYSFPSDHATFLMALGTYFYLLKYKKIGILIIIGSFLVGFSRVISGIHYPLDVVCGLMLGFLGAYLLHYLDKYIQLYLAEPILKIAKFIRLA